MLSRFLLSGLVAACLASSPALAGDAGFFADLELLSGAASGSSNTTDGGASWAGGGVVDNVRFGTAWGVGGHLGYHFDSNLSMRLGYRHLQGGMSWDATYPAYSIMSLFKGNAASDIVLTSLAHEFVLSEKTSFEASAGAGIAINSLSDILEMDQASSDIYAYLKDHTRLSPAAEIGASIRHQITANVSLGLSGSVIYSGGFETGTSRSVSNVDEPITPYRIDDVWRANLGVSARMSF